jgi:hypothetical protein
MRIDSSGNVGVGLTDPDEKLEIFGDVKIGQSGGSGVLHFGNASDKTKIIGRDNAHSSLPNTLGIFTDNAERMTFDASGNVGIGTSSPISKMQVSGANNGDVFYLTSSDVEDDRGLIFSNSSNGLIWDLDAKGASSSFGQMTFSTNGSERARIDSSGNLLVGKTVTSEATVGHTLGNTGYGYATANSGICYSFNRLSSDGEILRFRKDTSTVGSISTYGGNRIAVGNGDTNLAFLATSDAIIPAYQTSNRDNAIDLGHSSVRFDDIYATNGTIQTSDRNEKQDIAELSDAEQRVAVACKGLMRKFRWKDSVAEKGDDARIHFGIIAQDLQAAFEAEGLDAGDYAMFISTTWWEQDVEVPAVEAVDAVYETQTDEEGNETQVLVQEAVEAVDAYIRADTFETAEEAPEGATEKTRLGVRYSELLAFIISAI